MDQVELNFCFDNLVITFSFIGPGLVASQFTFYSKSVNFFFKFWSLILTYYYFEKELIGLRNRQTHPTSLSPTSGSI